MRALRLLSRPLVLALASLVLSASLASAAHVAPVLPLTSSPNHAFEKFSSTVFPAANYSGYSFAFADLANCTFSPGTDLSLADFTGANLTNVNFTSSVLDNATFAGANLSNSILPCMGGADFRGAILTGAVGGGIGCIGCSTWGRNRYDNCTVGPLPSLCLIDVPFRGVVAGVVFSDLNLNGVLDFGEPGIPGASVVVNAGPPVGPMFLGTSSQGGYSVTTPNFNAGTVTVTLPVGWILTGPALQNFNLVNCRSAQQLNFPATTPAVPAVKSTFGRVKALYR